MTMRVGIYLFDKAEVLDFAGPFEVFSTAARVWRNSKPDAERLFDVFTLSSEGQTVAARAGLRVVPDHSLNNHPPIDLLLIPGGIVSYELEKPEVIDWIRRQAGQSQITASVCTGAMLLAKAGLLDGLTATTHWEDIAELQQAFPGVQVLSDQRWVDHGHIITSAGISAGIDMSLHLVARLAGQDIAAQTARQMEFDWTERP
ncbi:MAG: thiamine biosynthesis protein ThiJ [Gammaproteobacteria bacterium HGW-Gammaproteobacteria-6]|nr:MAG: thiamine biosynthesis protein ThiJ [Gammaproteobacteria bacterium HGW-Gammaproteobacteria-6]